MEIGGRKYTALVSGLGLALIAMVTACSSGPGDRARTEAPASPPNTEGPTTGVPTPSATSLPRPTATPGPAFHSISASELTARDEGKPLLPVSREADIVTLKFPASTPRGQYAGMVLIAGARIVAPINGTVSASQDFASGLFGAYRYLQITPASGPIAELILAPGTTLASDIVVGSKVTGGTTTVAVYEQGRLGGNWSDYSILLSIFPSELAIPDAWATGLPAVLRSQP